MTDEVPHITEDNQPRSEVRLDWFTPSVARGASRLKEGLWYVIGRLFILTSIPWPSWLKASILRTFGAQIGVGVAIAPRIRIHMPWKLSIGDHTWIGEEAFILSLEAIVIGSNACVSQRAFLCAGNHDYTDPAFSYMGAPITIGDGAWVGAQSFVGPGVTVGENAVVSAGSVVLSDMPEGMVCKGNPCEPVRPRKIRSLDD